MPDVVLVHRKAGNAIYRCPSFRVALISQITVAVNGMVAAPLQFFTDRSFARTGNAFNQVISHAHCWMITNSVKRDAVSHGCRGGDRRDPREAQSIYLGCLIRGVDSSSGTTINTPACPIRILLHRQPGLYAGGSLHLRRAAPMDRSAHDDAPPAGAEASRAATSSDFPAGFTDVLTCRGE